MGYNRPELSKHRKRDHSRDTLLSLSTGLFNVLQYSFWTRGQWGDVKFSVDQLAHTLANYCDLLAVKSRRMNSLHASSTTVRSISSNLSVQFSSVRNAPPSYLYPIYDAIVTAGPENPIELGKFLPSDRRRRYGTIGFKS